MIKKLRPIWMTFFYVFFHNIIMVNPLWSYFINIETFIIDYFLGIMFLFAPNVYVSIEFINRIPLSSLVLKVILLTFSVITSCVWLLIFFCDFNTNLLFLMSSLSASSLFFLVSLFLFQVDLLLDNFHNLQV